MLIKNKNMSKDHFQHKADTYDALEYRVANVDNIARSLLDAIEFNRSMHIADFGAGTGLLLERVAPYVRKITAVDISHSMNTQLAAKRGKLPCQLDIVEVDLTKSKIDSSFKGVISSMTLHHIKDTSAIR